MADKKRRGGAIAPAQHRQTLITHRSEPLDSLPQFKADASRDAAQAPSLESRVAEIEARLNPKSVPQEQDSRSTTGARLNGKSAQPQMPELIEGLHVSIEALASRLKQLESRLEPIVRTVPEDLDGRICGALAVESMPQALAGVSHATQRIDYLIRGIDSLIDRLAV